MPLGTGTAGDHGAVMRALGRRLRAGLVAVACVGVATGCLRAAPDPATAPVVDVPVAEFPAGSQSPGSPGPVGKRPVAPESAFVVRRIATTDPVVFVTIDDGWVRDPAGRDLLVRSGLPVTLFLTNAAWRADRPYFHDLVQTGATVQDHTFTHPVLPKLAYARQKAEICQAADDDAREYSARPVLFRPPYGATSAGTERAAAECGMAHVVLWSAAVNDGRVDVDGSAVLRPGDIVLMHFRTTLAGDLTALLDAIARAGLTPARLEDYLSQRSRPATGTGVASSPPAARPAISPTPSPPR